MPRRLWSSPSASIRLISAPQPAATTTPVSSMRAVDQGPLPCPSTNTMTEETSAPANASSSVGTSDSPSSMPPSAKAAAPPDTPST